MTTQQTDPASQPTEPPGPAGTSRPSAAYGVHSEVGTLRKVLVCSPGLAHRRLTPSNSDDLLFDDVLWVENAQRDHSDFVNKLQGRGVDVVELHEVLAQTMAVPGRRSGFCSARSPRTRSATGSWTRPGHSWDR